MARARISQGCESRGAESLLSGFSGSARVCGIQACGCTPPAARSCSLAADTPALCPGSTALCLSLLPCIDLWAVTCCIPLTSPISPCTAGMQGVAYIPALGGGVCFPGNARNCKHGPDPNCLVPLCSVATELWAGVGGGRRGEGEKH